MQVSINEQLDLFTGEDYSLTETSRINQVGPVINCSHSPNHCLQFWQDFCVRNILVSGVESAQENNLLLVYLFTKKRQAGLSH